MRLPFDFLMPKFLDLAILLLFGGRKIPELMKGFGSGIKEFKKGLKEEDQEEKEK